MLAFLLNLFRRPPLQVEMPSAKVYEFPRKRECRCTAPTEQETVRRMKAEQQGLIDMEVEKQVTNIKGETT
jgi:hypothetical protein